MGDHNSEQENNNNCNYPSLPIMVPIRNEWSYSMRRTMQEIVPGVFLGPYSAAMKMKLDDLIANGITHIVCVRHALELQFIKPNFPDAFEYLVLDIADNVGEPIIKYFSVVRDFINKTLEKGGKVLVHGNSGISRSAALVISYIMEKYGLSAREAFSVVHGRRFCINPNEGFMAQLQEFEPMYRARKILQNGQTSVNILRNKRPFDSVEENMLISPQ